MISILSAPLNQGHLCFNSHAVDWLVNAQVSTLQPYNASLPNNITHAEGLMAIAKHKNIVQPRLHVLLSVALSNT